MSIYIELRVFQPRNYIRGCNSNDRLGLSVIIFLFFIFFFWCLVKGRSFSTSLGFLNLQEEK